MRGMYVVIYSHHLKLCCGGFSFTIRRMTAVSRMSEHTRSERVGSHDFHMIVSR
jgi:hypothetical protein